MDVKIYVLPLGGECTHIYLSVTALMHSIIQHMLAYVFLRLVTAGSPLLICNFFFFLLSPITYFPCESIPTIFMTSLRLNLTILCNNLMFSFFINHILNVSL